MQDIIWMVQNKLWDDEDLVTFMRKYGTFLFKIQNLVVGFRSGVPPFNPPLEELFQKESFQDLFAKLRTILKEETGTNPDGISDEDLYKTIVFPIGVYILTPERSFINTIHRN